MSAPTSYWADDRVTLYLGKCEKVLPELASASVDAIVTDPPYGLEFMGKEWDGANGFRRSLNPADAGRGDVFGRASRTSPEYRAGRLFQAWCEQWATECLRVLKPGGWLLAFGGTRTYHRLTSGIEDAGFEIRDSAADLTGYDAPGLMWVYGSGFPKNHDVSKAIDKAAGAEREVVGPDEYRRARANRGTTSAIQPSYDKPRVAQAQAVITVPATEDAACWEGWGTALKPGWEPIAVARKPLAGTVIQNVLTHGTGAMNVNGCRVDPGSPVPGGGGLLGGADSRHEGWRRESHLSGKPTQAHDAGRWPPNVLLGPEAAEELDRQSGKLAGCGGPKRTDSGETSMFGIGQPGLTYEREGGGASRFYPVFRYQAKAPAHERPRLPDGTSWPTVKPVDLMRWLVRLVTPPGGLVLDPFGGTGCTAEACLVEGFRCVLVEQDPVAVELIRVRLRKPIQPDMFGGVA